MDGRTVQRHHIWSRSRGKLLEWTDTGQHIVPVCLGYSRSEKFQGADGTQKGEMELAQKLDTGNKSWGLGVSEQTSQ